MLTKVGARGAKCWQRSIFTLESAHYDFVQNLWFLRFLSSTLVLSTVSMPSKDLFSHAFEMGS